MTEYHSSESTLSEFEDVEECSHDMIDYENPIGEKLHETKIEGVYASSFFCDECNHFMQEVYHFEGLQEIEK